MVSRYTGACLGLLAFATVVISGTVVGNPPLATLGRAVWALLIFCVIGLVMGACAQTVINEHHRQREEKELGTANGESAGVRDDATEAVPNPQDLPLSAAQQAEVA